jgi:hypothetical protein
MNLNIKDKSITFKILKLITVLLCIFLVLFKNKKMLIL